MDSSDDDYDQGKIERMQLAKALQFKVGTLCRQEEDEEHQGSTQKKNIRMSQSAIVALTELTYHYATKCLGPDLIQFSQHANRKTINVDDVKLAARRNPNGVLDSLQNFCENHQDQIDNGVGNKHRSKKRYRSSSSLNANISNIGVNRQYDISDSDDEKSDSDASLGVGPSSENIGRTASHDIKFDLQIHSSSSSSSDSGSNDGDDNEKHESDNDQIQSNVLSTGKNSSGVMKYQGTSSIHNGTSVLDDSDSDVEMRIKRNTTNNGNKDASRKIDDEYIELLDSD